MIDFQAPSVSRAYRFGGFRLDVSRHVLFREAQAIPLPDQVFQILLMLIEANGRVVYRDAIALRVWPETIATDGNIAQHIYLLRKLLGEHARDRGLVMAVSRKGYRLTEPVSVEPSPRP